MEKGLKEMAAKWDDRIRNGSDVIVEVEKEFEFSAKSFSTKLIKKSFARLERSPAEFLQEKMAQNVYCSPTDDFEWLFRAFKAEGVELCMGFYVRYLYLTLYDKDGNETLFLSYTFKMNIQPSHKNDRIHFTGNAFLELCEKLKEAIDLLENNQEEGKISAEVRGKKVSPWRTAEEFLEVFVRESSVYFPRELKASWEK